MDGFLKKQFVLVVSGVIWILAGLAGCSPETDSNPVSQTFDRKAFLTFVADSQVLPGYRQLSGQANLLSEAAVAFNNQPDQIRLEEFQKAWTTTFHAWQAVAVFQFGPAGESGTRKTFWEEVAIFPVRTAAIDAIIAGGAYNLNDFNRDTRGLMAMEYLLFSPEAVSLERLQAPSARNYLISLTSHFQSSIANVLSAWEKDYRSVFVSSLGTDIGSSTGLLYNDFVKSFENLKNFKLGLPLGKRPGQTGPDSTLSEARFSDQSFSGISLHFQSILRIWNGKSLQGSETGPGFKQYLENSEGGPELVAATLTQLGSIKAALDAIPRNASFNNMLKNADSRLETAHTELQKLTRYLKSDMSSILGISITYSSGDGD